MKKIYLEKIKQHNYECYLGKIDPRVLVKVAAKIGMGETQDAQRPLKEKRVKEIANYVAEPGGILPNTITLATRGHSFKIEKEADGRLYTNFPDKKEEFEKYKDCIDVMDGQHRLYSFLPDIRTIPDNCDFEIGFTLYIDPSLDTRRKIFISCNEKQEKVSGNLLMWFKEKLNMLTEEEKNYFDIVSKLNADAPLKNHIIMSEEKIKYGVKSKEIIAILKQSGIRDLTIGLEPLTNEQIVEIIRIYLSAWESVVGFSFSGSNTGNVGAAIKIAGLRFMLFLLPYLWERAITLKNQFTFEFVEETLKKMISEMDEDITYEEFFTCDEHKMFFRERSSTEVFASKCGSIIKTLSNNAFNPLS